MDFEMWNDEDKFAKWLFRSFILFLFIGGPGLTTLFLYLLYNHSL
jgi:hypothetical protein